MKIRSEQILAGLLAVTRENRSAIVWAACAVMAGFGITAVAVAPLVPSAEPPALRNLVETVQPESLDSQLQALANFGGTLARSDLTRGGDSVYSLLSRMGVRDAAAVGYMLSNAEFKGLFSGRAGKMVQVRTQIDGSLQELIARYPVDTPELAKTHFNRLKLERVDGGWKSSAETVPYGRETRLSGGTIRTTLFAATEAAGLPDAVAVQLAEIFSSEIDMHRQLRRGDTFSVVYDTLTVDDQPVAWNEGVGRVVGAEFVNGKKVHHAVWFSQEGQRGGYFNLEGQSKKNAFLASPMEFSRVTSGFAMRVHPIFQTSRPHLGVDYAAPSGTPVRSVGAGVVEIAGHQTGYGNYVVIKHDADRSTLYAHLSSMDVKPGQRVEQGQRIGGVGMTGWATGPHLHYEFRVKGVHQDPLLMARTAETTTLDQASKQRFAELAGSLQAKLDVAETLAGATQRTTE